jgi:hypothetical protein
MLAKTACSTAGSSPLRDPGRCFRCANDFRSSRSRPTRRAQLSSAGVARRGGAPDLARGDVAPVRPSCLGLPAAVGDLERRPLLRHRPRRPREAPAIPGCSSPRSQDRLRRGRYLRRASDVPREGQPSGAVASPGPPGRHGRRMMLVPLRGWRRASGPRGARRTVSPQEAARSGGGAGRNQLLFTGGRSSPADRLRKVRAEGDFVRIRDAGCDHGGSHALGPRRGEPSRRGGDRLPARYDRRRDRPAPRPPGRRLEPSCGGREGVGGRPSRSRVLGPSSAWAGPQVYVNGDEVASDRSPISSARLSAAVR